MSISFTFTRHDYVSGRFTSCINGDGLVSVRPPKVSVDFIWESATNPKFVLCTIFFNSPIDIQ